MLTDSWLDGLETHIGEGHPPGNAVVMDLIEEVRRLRALKGSELINEPSPVRRRYVAKINLQADTEKDLIRHLFEIATGWDRDGMSSSSVSGGYSSGHIIEVDCDDSITHESWEEALEQYLEQRKPTKEKDHA